MVIRYAGRGAKRSNHKSPHDRRTAGCYPEESLMASRAVGEAGIHAIPCWTGPCGFHWRHRTPSALRLCIRSPTIAAG